MKVIVISGHHKGIVGDMRGDLDERRKTLGKDGKISIRTDAKFPNNYFLVRIKHVEKFEQGELPV